jgi:hypothetical protein
MPVIIRALVLLILASINVQAGSIASPQGDSMLPLERYKLQKEKKIDNRIKIYSGASDRCLKAFGSAVSENKLESVPALLQSWINLLAESLRDIDTNVGRKKKSGALIEHEIRLRKSIKEVKDYKLRAPVEQQDYLDAWIDQAEKIQAKFLDILFLRK